MKESHRDLFFCKCVCWNLGKQELKDDLTLSLVILNWHWRNSQGEGVLMETIIINLAVKWRKQVSLGCGSGSNRRLLSNSWISAPGEMSAGCWFPLLQQLCMNWLPQETRVGMWLVVPQPYGTRKRKSLVWSHPGTWLKVLGGQPGSLDQTFVISSRCFQTKKKKICFSLALRICCVFLKQKENLKGHFFAFLWRLYSWLQTISLILKPLSAFFPFGPACPFCWQRRLAACRLCYPREAFFQVVADIPVRDRDSAQCPAQPHCSLLGPCSLWNPSIFSTSTELRGEPCCALGGQQALGVFLLPQHLLSLSHS